MITYPPGANYVIIVSKYIQFSAENIALRLELHFHIFCYILCPLPLPFRRESNVTAECTWFNL